jgi:hypothetical protein
MTPRALVESWFGSPVPRDHRESDAAFAHRRRIVATTAVVGAGLLGRSLSTKPDSRQFYSTTLATAATWAIGGLASGPLHLGWSRRGDGGYRRPVVTPIMTGASAFVAFYGAALVAQHVPVLDTALRDVLQYAQQGSDPLLLLTALSNGLAEEVFFRGAAYAAAGVEHPVAATTAGYVLATSATRNPALVLASAVMGTLFAWQRHASGGIQAPVLTHLTWSALMLRYLPPLYKTPPLRDALTPAVRSDRNTFKP